MFVEGFRIIRERDRRPFAEGGGFYYSLINSI